MAINENWLTKPEDGTKPVYKNPKSGKYYTICGEGENAVLLVVYIDDAKWKAAEPKVDKKGRCYKIFDLVGKISKNQHPYYQG